MSSAVRALQHLAYATSISTRCARSLRSMRILMMHGIGDPDHPEGAFLRQMEYLKANFRVVPLDSILGKLAGDDGRPDGEVALSFDDGLRSHLTVVYPILARLRLPATFFICPGLVEEGRWQWNHECTERLRSLAPQALDGLLRELALGGTPTGGKLVAWAIERIKALPAARRASAVAAIEGRTPRFRPSASQHAAHDVLTWEELRSLPAGLIGVGSHGWTHEVLAGIGAERLDLEIRESRQRIEQRLGRPVECFCYPNGIVDAPALESARRVYRAALTMRSGFVRPSDDPHLLARVWVPATLPALSWRLFRPRRSGWSGPSEAER